MNMHSSSLRVALLYNLNHPATLDPDSPLDSLLDLDSIETVQAIEMALLESGHQIIPLEADHTLFDTIRQVNPDICFNMARGGEGQSRGVQVPAILDMFNIPYTGSGILPIAISQSKARTKHACQANGLPTSASQVLCPIASSVSGSVAGKLDQELDSSLTFPLFVKPILGSFGMGVDAKSVVHNHAELYDRVERVYQLYHQPALVETYLPGREFVVCVLGNSTTNMAQSSSGLSMQEGYRLLPIMEIDSSQSIDKGILSAAARAISSDKADAPRYYCPAPVTVALHAELTSLAIAAFEAIGAVDIARVDFRLDSHGAPQILSINVSPSLDPYQSILAKMVAAEGELYDDFVEELLNLALDRHCLNFSRENRIKPAQSPICLNLPPTHHSFPNQPAARV